MMPIDQFDLFEHEQKVYESARRTVNELRAGANIDPGSYERLCSEYGVMLEHLRRVTHISDRTTTVLHESNLNLSDKVYYDALTDIYNRRYMEDSIPRVVSSLTRSGNTDLSVMLLDLDFFKHYNDTYGHAQGDCCLKAVAETLKNSVLRPDDFVARYGGEEFIVILPGTHQKGARKVADRILENVRALEIHSFSGGPSTFVTISIGVTTADVSVSHDFAQIVNMADNALYISKQHGRDRYTFIEYREGMMTDGV
ncbi:MAG: GGDEF domain-containing protein [Oscillospiraceae bacterium]|jgi:diguanylate cyclase (GGDEF)-like protein|nr:GGDEF domain-containing protein [Oscillospiraceae bacterium]